MPPFPKPSLGKPGVLLFLAVLVIACLPAQKAPSPTPLPPARGKLAFFTLMVDHTPRRYALYVPPDVGDTPLPLVLELHGGGVTIEDMTGLSGHASPYKLWMDLADTEHFIVVYPEGLNGAYGKPTWNDCRGDATVNAQADDVVFLSALIQHLEATYPVDPRRVYVSGTSNGGLMALRLAVEIPNQLAAVAAVAAAMPAVSACPEPSTPISVVFINGTQDNHLPYQGGTIASPPNPAHGSVLSTEASVRLWVEVDKADPTPLVTLLPDRDPRDHSTVTRYAYLHGQDDTAVVLYEVQGGGHSAPSIHEQFSWLFEHYFGPQNHDIETVQVLWQFFQQHQR